MKPRESVIRLKMFQLREKRRQLEQLAMMIDEFERMAGELEAQIIAEEHKWGLSDVNHFTYPPLARAARQRREKLRESIEELQSQKANMQRVCEEAQGRLDQICAIEARESQIIEQNRGHSVQRLAIIGR